MNRFIILTLTLLNVSTFSWWTKSQVIQNYCNESITQNGKYRILHYPLSSYTDNSIILTHKKTNTNLIKLNKSNGEILWKKRLKVKPLAIANHKKYVFVLTSSELHQHNAINGDFIQKISFNNNIVNKYEVAQDLAVKEDIVFVSLGTGGINTYYFDDNNIIYSENFNTDVNPDGQHRSYITGVSLSPNQDQLLVAIDNITLSHENKAFEGFLILDSEYLNIIDTLPLKNNREVLGKPLVHWNFENNFLVNNLNVLMGFKTKKKPRRRNISPNKRFLKYANGGRPLGRVLVEKNEIRYCELVGKAHQKHAIPAIMTYEP
jgi:outer membrane protein assembly factor BamB